MKLGDFDALLEKIQFRIPCDNAVAAIVNECVKITKYLIKNAPAIDAEPVRHGRWEVVKVDAVVTEFKCSECGRKIRCGNDYYSKPTEYVDKSFPYCHCGAKMDGGAC